MLRPRSEAKLKTNPQENLETHKMIYSPWTFPLLDLYFPHNNKILIYNHYV